MDDINRYRGIDFVDLIKQPENNLKEKIFSQLIFDLPEFVGNIILLNLLNLCLS